MTGTAATVKTGNLAPAPDPDCVELSANNAKARQEIIDTLSKKKKKTKAEKKALKKAKGKGMTVASVKRSPSGATATTSSDGTANEIIPNSQCDGGTSAQKVGLNKKTRQSKAKKHEAKKKKAGVLCGNSHVHPGGGKGAHSEAKGVNCLTNSGDSMRGGSMTFNIDWRSGKMKNGQTSGMPCEDCLAMMCHAAKECEIKIYICDHKNQKQELTENDCNSDAGYRNLSKRVDGNPTPGR